MIGFAVTAKKPKITAKNPITNTIKYNLKFKSGKRIWDRKRIKAPLL
jgi:hypothetical protein